MDDTGNPVTRLELEAERLKLERESLAVERERLDAARVYAAAEAKLAAARRPVTFFFCSALLVVLAFVGGVIAGFSYSEHQRDLRLKETLSQLDQLGDDEGGTNISVRASGRPPLSVTVIQ